MPVEHTNSFYYDEMDRYLESRSGEHSGISPLTFRKIKLSKESATRDHLLICNNIPSFHEFTLSLHNLCTYS